MKASRTETIQAELHSNCGWFRALTLYERSRLLREHCEKAKNDALPRAEEDVSGIDGGSTKKTADDPLTTAGVPLKTPDGSSNTADGSSNTADGSSNTADGSSNTADGSSNTATEDLFQVWKNQRPFNDDTVFHARLRSIELNEATFRRAISTSDAVLSSCCQPPKWLIEILQAIIYGSDRPLPALLEKKLSGSFLTLIAPFLHTPNTRLTSAIRHYQKVTNQKDSDFDRHASVFYDALEKSCLVLLNYTLILELHVSKLTSQLYGESADERYQAFISQLGRRDRRLELFREYPVLARITSDFLETWTTAKCEFLHRLGTDWQSILDKFNHSEHPGALVSLTQTGDTHRNGRSVMIAGFESGFQVVYKPRSLLLETHFTALLVSLNAWGEFPPLRPVKTFDRGDYGWQEFVSSSTCTQQQEVTRFFERQGAYLALLYFLRGHDFHSENVIAAGEHPMLIDLEALFRPVISCPAKDRYNIASRKEIEASVFNVMLLPYVTEEGRVGGGLVSWSGQSTTLELVNPATDEMKFRRVKKPVVKRDNTPTLNDKSIDVSSYENTIISGFKKMCDVFIRHRSTLLSSAGPLCPFRNDKCRIVLRPTSAYALLLKRAVQPASLRDALERDRRMDDLWIATAGMENADKTNADEHSALLRNDVPLFTAQADSRDLILNSGKVVRNFFERSGWEVVQQRLTTFTRKAYHRQLWYIRACFATLPQPRTKSAIRINKCRDRFPKNPCPIYHSMSIGDELERLAVRDNGNMGWIGLNFRHRRFWRLEPLGADLPNGLTGIALFLASLGVATNTTRYTALAKQAVLNATKILEHKPASSIGFDGLGGLVYSFSHLSRLWKDQRLLDRAEALIDTFDGSAASAKSTDGLYERASGIMGVLSFLRCRQSKPIENMVVEWGEDLSNRIRFGDRRDENLEHQHDCHQQVRRPVYLDGVKLSLKMLVRQLGPDKLRLGSITIEPYESPCRTVHPSPYEPLGPGPVLLARAADHDTTVLRRISTFIESLENEKYQQDHSLVKGEAGLLDFISQACLMYPSAGWHQLLERRTAVLLARLEHSRAICATTTGVETPGLSYGMAGIGYSLLRLSRPSQLPSLCSFELPGESTYAPFKAAENS
ncbi:type 2 lantipeptide synthetase LanM [Exilibacterium tricleocarpae]|uniref:Type 2 lantipeptide synthetase LanM n=1 Tax=Exilibacterium tricleocarpae TaxID=2591008 RepID=A0A545U458_9GAMM|nr:type 2 lanthipeptide synthetase LanM [Exilibacterium tricleocarpae]TQV84259.1 type 2 lantipeptide synthetase LanM [Exilibacterium tricleocarpae]